MQAVSRADEFPAPDSSSEVAVAEGPYPWILHPAIDILFCCGGLLWILMACEFWIGKSGYDNPMGQIFLYGGLLGNWLLGDAHVPATYFRIFSTPELRAKIGAPCIVSGALLVGLSIVSMFNPPLAGVFYRIWIFWIVQHFLAQSYGITLLYCFKRQYFMNYFEKKLLWCVFHSTLIYTFLLCCPDNVRCQNKLFELPIPFWTPLPPWALPAGQTVLQLVVVAFALACIRKYVKEKKMLPFPAALIIVSSVVFFASPLATNKLLNSVLAAFYHGSQYLVITAALYVKQRGLPEGVSFHQIASQLRTKQVLRWFATLVGIGVCIWVFLPWLLEQQLGFGVGLVIASIQVSYSFHHFLLDAYIWRLRDPKLRKLLVA